MCIKSSKAKRGGVMCLILMFYTPSLRHKGRDRGWVKCILESITIDKQTEIKVINTRK
jgi:hypothetical protein